jgi:hypothetical protein
MLTNSGSRRIILTFLIGILPPKQWAAEAALGILETTWKQILVPPDIAPDIGSSDGYRTGGGPREVTLPGAPPRVRVPQQGP